MVKRKQLILGSIVALTMSAGIVNSAMADTQILIEIRNKLSDIETKFKNYKDNFEDYYGINANGYAKPTSTELPGFADAKTLRNNLATLGADKTNQTIVREFDNSGQVVGMGLDNSSNSSLTQEDLVSFMSVPFSAKDCADCKITVDKIYERNAQDLTFPYFKVSQSEILSSGTVGSGYKNPAAAAPLNANSLLGPLKYGESSVTLYDPENPLGSLFEGNSNLPRKIIGKNALSFIQHLISFNRFRINPKLPAKSELTHEGVKARNEYLARLYTFASQVSIGISNINQMYASRVPNAGGKSKLEAENDMVMRHMKADWQDSIKNGNPAMVQKEMVFLLAEMNYQLYQNRLLMERLLLTASAQQLSQARPPHYNAPIGSS